MTWILGVNVPPVGWHDTAACLVDETGQVYAMAEEERFSRTKHGVHQQPTHAVEFCLRQAGITAGDVDVVAIGWDVPRLYEANRMPWTYTGPDQLLDQIGLTRRPRPDLVMVPHHRAHAICSWYASGLADAAVIVVDGNGEDESASVYEARRGQPLVRRLRWPRAASLGLMYAAVSEVLGFGLLGSGKTMGLASYGRDLPGDPWPMLDEKLNPPFPYHEHDSYDQVMTAWRKHIGQLLGSHVLGADLDLLAADGTAVRLAWSAQYAVEVAMAGLVELARRVTGLSNVCLSGGVALNCSANGMLPGPLYAPPVPHDAGVALGAAWSLSAHAPDQPLSPFLGPETGPAPVPGEVPDLTRVVELLRAGQIGAIAEGRAEAGPRALGHRSIIAIPNSTGVRDEINRRKGREPWRPLAPVATDADAGRFWRPIPALQRYMLGATEATAEGRATIPGAVHVDGTVRAQVVDDGGTLNQILVRMGREGLPPVLINTSLNTRGEPLVTSAAEALAAFDAIGLDFIIVDGKLVTR